MRDLARVSAGDLAPVKPDRAGRRRKGTCNQVERGALAGAIGPDEAEDFSLANLEGHAADCGESPEGLGQALDEEHRARSSRSARVGMALGQRQYGLGS